MADPKPTIQLRQDWRDKIKTSLLINRLSDHALSEDGEKMTASQIKAAEILLRKTFPDLTANELTGAGGGPLIPSQYTDEQLALIASRGSEGAAASSPSAD